LWFTKKTLIEYAWDKHDRFWTLSDVNRLIKKGFLKTHKLGNKIVFRTKEVGEYFAEQRRRNFKAANFGGSRRRTYRQTED